ncbi:ubiquinone biosynthesis accessory factor UbiJ [Testudinibacter sp. P27/CKL/0425]
MLPNWEQLKTQLMLPQLASAAIETALAQLLRRSENHQPHLRKLNGKTLALQLQQPEMNCYFVFSAGQIDVLHQYEGEADCTVQTSAKTLINRPKKAELTQYLNDQSIVLHGDLQVLQDFLGLIDALEKDPAELLSPYLGDVVAYNATRAVRQGLAFFCQQQQTAQQHWGERLTEEWQLAAPKLAIADFQQQLTELTQQHERVEQKLQRLSAKLKPNKQEPHRD